MNKKLFAFLILLLIWIAMFFLPRARAEVPIRQFPVPVEICGDKVKEYAYERVYFEWGESHWSSFYKIIEVESSWNPTAKNPKSTAFGLGQLLDSTRMDLKLTKTDDPFLQIDETIAYINDRYGNPQKAWGFWSINKWY